jgi:two-component system, OmpR family, alkaline phosphatase synthesis response regulator PhoP
MKAEVLIVEDDLSIATGLSLNLEIAGYAPTVVGDGEAALAHLEAEGADLVLLDMNLPRRSGLEVLHDLRERGDRTPVIVVSARQDEYDKVAALRLGADDYVTKPFALAELLARLEAVLRRVGYSSEAPVTSHNDHSTSGFAGVEVDFDRRQVTREGAAIRLTHLEFELLCFFLHNPTRVFSRAELLRAVWGQAAGTRRTIDNFVGQLRAKLERHPETPEHFITVRGSGYRFDP